MSASMSAGMNVIFRGNGKRKAERESRKRLHLQRRSLALKPPAVQRERYRYREEERGSERGCCSCKVRRESAHRSQRWERKEKREEQWKARVQRFLPQKAPCYSHDSHKLQKEKKNEKKISSARLVFEIICK